MNLSCARMIAPYLQKYLPGAKVVVENVTEGGGIVGKNKVYTAKPDGLTLGLTNGAGTLLAEWAEAEGVKYKTTEFSWLGRLYAEPQIMVVSAKSQVRTLDDILKAKKLTVGISGVGSPDYYVVPILAKVLGFQVDPKTGYANSNEISLACVKGEVDAFWSSYGTVRPLIDAKTVVPVLVFSHARLPELPNVPTILELTSGDNQKTMKALIGMYDLDRVMIAPPGLPAGRLKALRDALDKAMADPEFKQTSEKLKRPVLYLSGDETEKLLENIKAIQDQLRPLVKEINQSSQ